MEESALEEFFDKYIANDSSKMEEEQQGDLEEDEEEQKEEGQQGDLEEDEEEFLRLLPDELLLYSSEHLSLQQAPQAPPPEMEQEVKPPQIHNIVSTVKLGCSLNLDVIAREGLNVEYRPKVCRCLLMRLRKPRASAMIYNNGSLVVTGTRSVKASHVASRRFARILQRLGFPVRFLDFKVQTIMATGGSHPMDLPKMASQPNCRYDPDMFHALRLQVKSGMTAEIFTSGKIVIMGAKTEDEVHKTFEEALQFLRPFKRTGPDQRS